MPTASASIVAIDKAHDDDAQMRRWERIEIMGDSIEMKEAEKHSVLDVCDVW